MKKNKPSTILPSSVLIIILLIASNVMCGHGPMGPIPDDSDPGDLPLFIGEPALPRPLPPKHVPEHPYISPGGCVHVDLYNSDVTDWGGPLGRSPRVLSRSMGRLLGSCVMRVFGPGDNVASLCYYFGGINIFSLSFEMAMDLVVFKPGNIEVIDLFPSGIFEISFLDILRGSAVDLSGCYYYMDNRGRIVHAAADNAIRIIKLRTEAGVDKLELQGTIDLKKYIKDDAGSLIAVNPDYSGNLWFMTQKGLLGCVDISGDRVILHSCPDELFENSMAIAPDGLYVATDCALYRVKPDFKGGKIATLWRQEYDRSDREKPGMLSRGTGTTPTLLGDDLVVITDNADERVNLIVLNRLNGDEVCRYPLFEKNKSVVEVSPVGYSDKAGMYFSIIVQNNYNAPGISGDYSGLGPGLARIDVLPEEKRCVHVWTNNDVPSTGVPKLSTATGLIYTYTQLLNVPVDRAWYLAAVDFRTGKTVYMVRLGTGDMKHNYYATVDIGPDGTAYQGVVGGMIAVMDGE